MKMIISSFYEGKESQLNTTANDFIETKSDSYNFCNNNSTFISPIYTLPWREL